MEDMHERLKRVAGQRAEADAARHGDASRGRLLRILRRKFQTTFVGDLALFEAHFGALWGHGLPPGGRSESQRAWLAVWEECRNEVLDNGNKQFRAVEAEVAQYAVGWDRYRAVLPAAPACTMSSPGAAPQGEEAE